MQQFVTFKIDGHLLGLQIAAVREINRALDFTPAPTAPPYVVGLINLRGQIVTVFDLGLRLGLGPRPIDAETHNVIMKAAPVALLVDRIGDVVQAPPERIGPPPANLRGLNPEFFRNLVKMDRDLLLVLSSEKLLEYQPPAAVDSMFQPPD